MKIYDYQGKANICGENIRKYRIAKKISQKDFAARLQACFGIQLEQKAISRIEMGQRFIADYELFAISKVLGINVMDLYSSTELQGGRE